MGSLYCPLSEAKCSSPASRFSVNFRIFDNVGVCTSRLVFRAMSVDLRLHR